MFVSRGKMSITIEAPERRGNVLRHGTERVKLSMRSQSTRTCTVESCNRPRHGRGLCRMHYQRWTHHGTTETIRDLRTVCSIDGCDRAHSGRGYCRVHYRDLIAGPTYRVWEAMKARCFNPKTVGFSLYGGRGITVCERWTLYENFLADMGERPAAPPDWKGKRAYWSLDRIDVNGNYEPGNCRWATASEQAFNRRKIGRKK